MRGSVGQRPIRPHTTNTETLSEEEMLFLWKGLVDHGQLHLEKLQMFMKEVAGVNMSEMQARDLLEYMDANGDGRVGMEDFNNFLSIGHISETTAHDFMWEPKKKYRQEHPNYKLARSVRHDADGSTAEHPGVDGHHHNYDEHHKPDQHRHHGPRGSIYAQHHDHHGPDHHGHFDNHHGPHHDNHHGARHDHHDHDHHDHRRSRSPGDEHDHHRDPTRPQQEAPQKRRPAPHHGRHSATHDPQDFGNRYEQPHTHREYGSHANPAAATPSQPKKNAGPKAPALTPEMEKKMEQAILKYEQKCWDEFILVEHKFKRQLFERFAGPDGDELTPTDYHKMLLKWMPLASWCAPCGLKPADSLAALEYVQRKDLEERGLLHRRPSTTDGGIPVGDGTVELPPPPEPRMPYGVWLDVLNGKHRPEEHGHHPANHATVTEALVVEGT